MDNASGYQVASFIVSIISTIGTCVGAGAAWYFYKKLVENDDERLRRDKEEKLRRHIKNVLVTNWDAQGTLQRAAGALAEKPGITKRTVFECYEELFYEIRDQVKRINPIKFRSLMLDYGWDPQSLDE